MLKAAESPDKLVTEARARIIWGDEATSVRYFLVSNGMSAADADSVIRELVRERNAEIRKLGIRDLLIGGVLLGFAGVFFYFLFTSPSLPRTSVRSAKGYGGLALLGLIGLWKLITGIFYLVRPKSEHGSIPDLEE